MRILHVTDCWLAGVATAITGWIAVTPGLDHVVLARGRRSAADQTAARPAAATWADLPWSSVDATRAIGAAIDWYRPDVVHAHSSRAGVAVRLRPAPAIAYSPHGFGFLRTDLARPWRTAIRAVEQGLARRRQVVVACGEQECTLAHGLGAHHVVTVPYALPAGGPTVGAGGPASTRPTVAFMGRICPQKGVGFAVETAARLCGDAAAIDVVWIGGGDAALTAQLRAAGVEVTGWLDRGRAVDRLTAADVYVHTAAWEGCPLTVLEALQAGVPVVARALPALDGLPVVQRPDPASVAAAVAGLLVEATAQPARRPPWVRQPDEIAAVLIEAYRLAADS